MANKKTIGILAGMGPHSTAPFVEQIVAQCQLQYGAKLDEEFPHMMIYSLPTPFYIDRPIDHEKMKATVISGLKRLESTGVSFIAIPCNTVHAYFDELKSAITVKLINIVEESVKELTGAKQIALLSTKPTVESQAYQQYIKRAGAQLIHSNLIQERVNSLIAEVKSGKTTNELASAWMALIDEARAEGADSAIIACTDLSRFSALKTQLAITDSSLALAKAVVLEYLKP